MRLQLSDILLGANEGVPDEIGASIDEPQILAVLLRERRQAQCAVWQIHALVGTEPGTAEPGSGDGDLDHRGTNGADDAADGAVVEPDRLAGTHIVEYGGQRQPY
jgi:hypothetical protein